MKRFILYLIIFVVVDLFIGSSIMSHREKRLAEYRSVEAKFNSNNYKAAVNTYKKFFNATFKNNINVDEVKYYLREAYLEPHKRDKDRQMLYNYTLPVFESLKNINIKQMQYHFPDSTSFLRMHTPTEYGDSLSPFRRTVILANEKNKFYEGFESGKHYTGYRYVYPINSTSEHLGTVEFVIGIDGLINTMNELYGNSYKYAVMKDYVVNHKDLPMDKISDDIFMDSCSSCSSEVTHYADSLNINNILRRDISTGLKDKFYKFREFTYVAKYNDSSYILTFLPVTLTDGKGAGYIIGYHESRLMNRINRYYMVLFGFSTLAALMVLAVIFILDSRRRMTLISNQKLEETVRQKVVEIHDTEQFFAQQAKMVTMGEMLTAILHQWKQPLTSISLMADMLDFECTHSCGNEDAIKLVQEIKAQTKFMAQTDRDFRKFLKPSNEPEIFNVCDAVDDVVKLFEFGFAKHNVAFDLNLEETACAVGFIKGYPNEFKHILLNLFCNARDAISALRERMIADGQNVAGFKGVISVSVAVYNGKIRVTVADTGGGIPEEIMGNIFNQYFSTKAEKGTGIGLYMTKNLVENNMNGNISVRNINKGAEFTIEFNAAQKE